jgi:GT2 family glycosyltransferase
MNQKKVSVIISNYQGKDYLPKCLEHLMNQTYCNYEVLIVDAGSTDGGPDFIEKEFKDVKLYRCGRIGIGEAINIGIRNATGEIICFDFNTDEFASPDWIEQSVNFLEKYNYNIITGTTRIIHGTNLIDEAGLMLDFLLRSKKRGHGCDADNFCFEDRPVDFVGSPMFHRKLIKEIGLIDERYFIYAEDLDFCYRAKKIGVETRCAPLAISYHCIRGTMGRNVRRLEYFLRRANIRFQIKFSDSYKIIFGLFYLCVFLPFIALLVAISGSRESKIYYEKFIGRLLAVWWNIKNFNRTRSAGKQKRTSRMIGKAI